MLLFSCILNALSKISWRPWSWKGLCNVNLIFVNFSAPSTLFSQPEKCVNSQQNRQKTFCGLWRQWLLSALDNGFLLIVSVALFLVLSWYDLMICSVLRYDKEQSAWMCCSISSKKKQWEMHHFVDLQCLVIIVFLSKWKLIFFLKYIT